MDASFLRQRFEQPIPPLPLHIEGFRPAAVLVPLVEGYQGLEVVFTVRSAQLSNHAGQISFPGGRVDAGETSLEAALREVREEIGLELSADQVLGELDQHPSPARYVVTPYVAIVPEKQVYTLNPAEVAEVFHVPLKDLLGLHPRSEARQLFGYKRRLFYYDWQDRVIWGLTGNIIKNLHMVLEASNLRPWLETH